MAKSRTARWVTWLAGGGLVASMAVIVFVLAQVSFAPDTDLKSGNADATSAPAPQFDPADALLGTDSSLSARKMQLVLIATAPGRTPREGTATLGTDPRNPQTYAAGAQLVNGAIVKEIHVDHIVLELNGIRSKLTVGKKSLVERLTSRAPKSEATTVGGASARQPIDTMPTSREDLSEVIRPEPVFDDRGYAGLRVLPGRYRHKLDLLGLKSGDIVRTVEGRPMRSADEAWQILDDAISTGSSIVVTVEREGTLSSMVLDGSRIVGSEIRVQSLDVMPRPQS